MGIVSRLFERRYNLSDLDRWMDRQISGVPTATGLAITEEGALAYSAVYACVLLIAEAVGSLPLMVYRRVDEQARRRDPTHPLYALLHDQPNAEMTSMEMRAAFQGHLLLWGNAYAEIESSNGGRPKALWPLRPDRMKPDAWGADGRLIYRYRLPDGTDKFFHSSLLVHLRGLASNGIVGYSPIALARQGIALGMAAEEYGARFFGNNSRPGGVLQTKGVLKDHAAKRLKESWEEAHRGLSNAQRVAILEEGVEWKQIGMPNEDAEWLATRKFQVSDIARYFLVPPHMIGDVEKSTSWGAGIAEQKLGFLTFTLRPWLERWEQRLTLSLLTPKERLSWLIEHNVEGLLRTDQKSRYEAYHVARNDGWLSANEIRALENLNPIADPSGDDYLVPLNMAPADQLGTLPLPTSLPGPRSMLLPDFRSEKWAALEPGASQRRRIAERYLPLFQDTAERIVTREVKEVGAAVDRILGRRSVPELDEWLKDYYGKQPNIVKRIWMPMLRTYAEAIYADAAAEVGAALILAAEDRAFIDSLGVRFSDAYARRSLGQMTEVLRDAITAGDDPLTAIRTRLDEWEVDKAERTAKRETAWGNSATTHYVYKKAGVTRIRWQAVGKSCQFCARMNGKVVGIDEVFLKQGDELADEEGGTPFRVKRRFRYPPLHRACLPGYARVAPESVAATSKRWYDGNLIVIYTARGHQLSCTPNHPILTPHGWIPASALYVGSNVISHVAGDWEFAVYQNGENVPVCIEDIVESFVNSPEMFSIPVPVAAEDFHGDGIGSQVTIIGADRLLMRGVYAPFSQQLMQNSLVGRNSDSALLSGQGSAGQFIHSRSSSLRSDVGGTSLLAASFLGHERCSHFASVAMTPYRDASIDQVASNNQAANTDTMRYGVFGLPGNVGSDKVVRVEINPFHGYVYNLQTASGFYMAEGIITHNCDCSITPG